MLAVPLTSSKCVAVVEPKTKLPSAVILASSAPLVTKVMFGSMTLTTVSPLVIALDEIDVKDKAPDPSVLST